MKWTTSSRTRPAISRQVLVGAVRWPAIRVVADGARWIRAWFGEMRAVLPGSALIVAWWHRCKRGRARARMARRGRKAKAALLRPVYRHLWPGEVAAAVVLPARPSYRDSLPAL